MDVIMVLLGILAFVGIMAVLYFIYSSRLPKGKKDKFKPFTVFAFFFTALVFLWIIVFDITRWIPSAKEKYTFEVARIEKDIPNTICFMSDTAMIDDESGKRIKAIIRTDNGTDKDYYIKERYSFLGLYFDTDYVVLGTKAEATASIK